MFQAQPGAQEAGRHLLLASAESGAWRFSAVVVLWTGLCVFDPQQSA